MQHRLHGILFFQYTSDVELHSKYFDDHMTTTKDSVHHEISVISDELNTNSEAETAIPEMILSKAKIVFYDLETTGLDVKTQHDGIGKRTKNYL